jgi:hypothetical protein
MPTRCCGKIKINNLKHEKYIGGQARASPVYPSLLLASNTACHLLRPSWPSPPRHYRSWLFRPASLSPTCTCSTTSDRFHRSIVCRYGHNFVDTTVHPPSSPQLLCSNMSLGVAQHLGSPWKHQGSFL